VTGFNVVICDMLDVIRGLWLLHISHRH